MVVGGLSPTRAQQITGYGVLVRYVPLTLTDVLDPGQGLTEYGVNLLQSL